MKYHHTATPAAEAALLNLPRTPIAGDPPSLPGSTPVVSLPPDAAAGAGLALGLAAKKDEMLFCFMPLPADTGVVFLPMFAG
jgi:hypothetical protein